MDKCRPALSATSLFGVSFCTGAIWWPWVHSWDGLVAPAFGPGIQHHGRRGAEEVEIPSALGTDSGA